MSSLPDAKKRASDRRAKLLASAAEVDSYKPDDDEHNESHNEPEGAAEDDGGEQEREQPRALKHQRGKGRVASTGPPSKKYLRKRRCASGTATAPTARSSARSNWDCYQRRSFPSAQTFPCGTRK